MRFTSLTYSLVLGLGLSAVGCMGATDDDSACSGAKCDGTEDFATQLDGLNDPIAKWLRTQDIDEEGLASFDYTDVALGVAKVQECDSESWISFVVSDPLVEGNVFPRVVSTVCSDDAQRASEFFIAASFKDEETNDVDVERLEMFAWDTDAGIYRFYATEVVEEGLVQVEVNPTRCRDCHLTPSNLSSEGMRMTPVMNELTQPWSHWNSEVPMFNTDGNPFVSHAFDVPREVRTAPNFVAIGRDRVDAARQFEQVIRAGHSRVAGQRTRDRRERSGDWRPAMNLLRPLFCAEQINYATEDFETGLIPVSALVSGGIREAYINIRPDNWPWQWLNNQDQRVRMQAPQNEPPLFMVPVRGNADIDYENRLVASRTLTSEQVLRVRALDWKRPVFSELRCGLWKDALARFEETAPAIDLSGRNSTIMRSLYDDIMTLDGNSLLPAAETDVISLDLATDAAVSALKQTLADGNVGEAACGALGSGFCVVDVNELGAMIHEYIEMFMNMNADEARVQLRELRDQRLCTVLKFFENAPALPPVDCPDDEEPEEPTEGATTFTGSVTGPLEIPDNDTAGVSSIIDAVDAIGLTIRTVQVQLDITHTWRGDLTIALTSPEGVTVEVVTFEELDSGDDVVGRFDVAGFTANAPADGEWTLKVIDSAGADTGHINGWTIGINTPAP